jgi:hypothetical protein
MAAVQAHETFAQLRAEKIDAGKLRTVIGRRRVQDTEAAGAG